MTQKVKFSFNYTNTTNTTNSNNNIYLNSLPNTSSKLKPDNQYSKSISNTDYNLRSYLDYTFKNNRNNISSNKIMNLKKLNNYNFELQQTLKLNIEILLTFISSNNITNDKKQEDNKKEEIVKLITDIQNKRKLIIDKKKEINQNANELIKKNDIQNKIHKKIHMQNQKYISKIDREEQYMKQCKIFIDTIQNNFNCVSKYINNLLFVNYGKKANLPNKNNFLEIFIKSNDKYHKDVSKLTIEITKIKENIEYIKKDNKLYKSKKKLYKDKKPDLDLIRVTEFYARVIRSISGRIRIFKNSINNLYQTLSFLDLDSIANFNKYRMGKTRQKSYFEIEFSKLDIEDDDLDEEIDINGQKNENESEEDNRIKCLSDKLEEFMDFDKVLNSRK